MYADTVEGRVASIAASEPLPMEPGDISNDIPIDDPDILPAPAPAPGLPRKLWRFSRSASGKKMTDYQVVSALHREAKANQKRVDHWSAFINKQGM